jgi:cytochrome P450
LIFFSAGDTFFAHIFTKNSDPQYQEFVGDSKKYIVAAFWRANQLQVWEDILTGIVDRLMKEWENTYAATEEYFDLFKAVSQVVALMNMRVLFGPSAYEAHCNEWRVAFPELDKLAADSLVTAMTWLPFGKPKRFRFRKQQIDAMVEDMFETVAKDVAESGMSAEEFASKVDSYGEYIAAMLANKWPAWILREHILSIAFAAHINTANILSWTMANISLHPEVVQRIRDEAENPNTSHESSMAQNCARETTRVYPGIVTSIRVAKHDQLIPGTDFLIKKGDMLSVLPHEVQRDPNLIPDPNTWKPQRFDDPEVLKALQASLNYNAFGSGVHRCLGEKLIMRMARQLFHCMFSRFDVELKDKTLPEPIWEAASNPFTKEPLLVRIKRRE